jgi:hypothetical protein
MSAVRRYAVLLVILVVIVGLVLVFRDRLSSSPTDLQVGDCFDLNDPNATTVEEVPHHPCTEAHHFEVIFKATDPSPNGAAYPGTTAFDKVVQDQCTPGFATYVGISFDDSTLDLGYLYPQADSWGKGRRTITCYVSLPNNATLTSTVKGSKK